MQNLVAPDRQRNGRSNQTGQQLDTTVDIVTPENIAFNYHVAGPFRRLCAFLIDVAIITGGLILLGLLGGLLLSLVGMLCAWAFGSGATQQILGLLSAVFFGIYLVLWFTTYWFYGALLETYWNGQTLGKRMMGIRAVTTSGEPINGLQATLRNILRAVDAFPLLSPAIFAGTFIDEAIITGSSADVHSLEASSRILLIPIFMLGFSFMLMSARFQRIGDLVCGTMVVIEERSWLMGVARVEDPRTPRLAALLPAKFQVSRSLAAALATYVERRQFFSQARRREIARHLGEPLLHQFGMPLDTSHDLLLCALYYRTFVTDRSSGETLPVASPPQVQRSSTSDAVTVQPT